MRTVYAFVAGMAIAGFLLSIALTPDPRERTCPAWVIGPVDTRPAPPPPPPKKLARGWYAL